jgi:hypothetical protein
MAFFSEIKARLGLDITPFEKGMAKAQSSARQATTEMGKNMAGVKGLVSFAAVTAGFNNALERAKELRDLAAETGTALDPAVQRTADLSDNLQRGKSVLADIGITLVGGLTRGVDYVVAFGAQMLGLVNGVNEAIESIDKGRAKEAKAEADKKKAAENAKTNSANKKKSDEAELALSVKAAEQFNKAADIKEEARKKTLTIDEKIKEEEAAIVQAEKDKADITKTSTQRLAAGVLLEQAKSDLADLQREQSEKQADKEKERTDKLKEQQKTLLEQKKTIEQTLAAQAKASLLPSMADVLSGKRNIGGVARGRATQLERDRASALDLADAEQRAREELASGIKTGGIYNPGGISSAKVDSIGGISSIMGEDPLQKGRAIRAQLDQTRSRITTNENLLGSRISDANPNAAMEKELLEIKTELQILNYTTLAPQNTK